jgi:hypothetical protein
LKTYRTSNLSFVLYGFQTWSLKLREEYRLRAFENRMLRTIFGPRRHKLTGEWRRLHNEELYNLYCSINCIRVIKLKKNDMGGECSTYGERTRAYRILFVKPEGKRAAGKRRSRCKYNIKRDIQEVE